MSIAALFLIVKKWKQLKCPLTDECISKMWYIHTDLLLGSNNKVLIHDTTWMNFKSKGSHAPKSVYVWFYLCEMSWVAK